MAGVALDCGQCRSERDAVVNSITASVPVTEELLAEHGARFVRDGWGDAVKIAWA